jgi:NarL family two-component system response regulator LiaR
MADKIRVLIADAHPVVRRGVEHVLLAQEDIALVGTAPDGEQALTMVGDLKPDVLVLELDLPKMDGLEIIRAVSRRATRPGIVVFARAAQDEQIRVALRGGARGFLTKDAPAELLVVAIRAVHQGGDFLQTTTAQKLVREGTRSDRSLTGVESLTPRELDTLRLLARGMSDREIAVALALRRHTVGMHVRSILAKLRVANRTQAAIYARDHGLA